MTTEQNLLTHKVNPKIGSPTKQRERKPVPFREHTFQVASMAEAFGIARSSVYNLEKEELIKATLLKVGTVEKKVYTWNDFAIVANRYQRRLIKALSRKVKVFANLKGGVGKSTLAVQVAMRAALMGYKVLVIDLDPQGHASLGFGKEYVLEELPTIQDFWFSEDQIPIESVIQKVTPLVGLIPANLSMGSLEGTLFTKNSREFFLKKTVEKLRDDWDLIIIDTNPSESNTNTNALLAADEICVVSATNFLSVNGLKHFFSILNGLIETFHIQPDVRVIPNLFDMRDGIAQESLGSMRKYYGEYLTKIVIRKNTDIAECQKHEQAISQYDKKSTGSEDIDSLTKELITETYS